MRIAMIGQKGIPAVWGGVERHVEKLSVELSRKGHEVFVYARRYYVDPKRVSAFQASHPNIHVRFLPTLHTKHLDAITHTFVATLRSVLSNVDVYHYHSVGPSLLSWIPRILRPHATVITTFHSPDRQHEKWGRFAKFMLTLGEWTALHFAHRTITVSQELQKYALDTYNASSCYIPNAVDEPVRAQSSMMTAQFDLRPREYLLLVSRLIPHKGVHVAIEAFKNMPELKQKLVIVGDSSHTEDYVKKLHKMAADDKRIIFTGFQHGRMLNELLTNAYAFIQPSFSEGLSIALLEAASYGLPVVCSNIEANKEVVREHAYTYTPNDVVGLQDAIARMLCNPKEAEEQAKILRQHVMHTYAWGAVADAVEELYSHARCSAVDAQEPDSLSCDFKTWP